MTTSSIAHKENAREKERERERQRGDKEKERQRERTRRMKIRGEQWYIYGEKDGQPYCKGR